MTDALDVSEDSPSLITTVSGLTMTSSSSARQRSGAREELDLSRVGWAFQALAKSLVSECVQPQPSLWRSIRERLK